MAATVDAAASYQSAGVDVTSASWTHVCASNATLLLVSISSDNDTGVPTVAVTYNGVSMTAIPSGTAQTGTTTTDRSIFTFYLVNPAVGSHSVAFTLTGTTSGTGVVGGSVSFLGSDTTTPLGTAVNNQGSASTASVTTTGSTANDLVFSTVSSASTSAPTAGTGITSQFNLVSGTNLYGVGGTQTGGASVVSTWTTGAVKHAMVGVAVRAAPQHPYGSLNPAVMVRSHFF